MKINLDKEIKNAYEIIPELSTTESISKKDIKLLLGGMVDIIEYGMNYFPIVPLKIYLTIYIKNGYKEGKIVFTLEVISFGRISIEKNYQTYTGYAEFDPSAMYYKVDLSKFILGFPTSLINVNLNKDMILSFDSSKFKSYLLENTERVFKRNIEKRIYNEIVGHNTDLKSEQREIIKQKLISVELIDKTIKSAIEKNQHLLLDWNFKALCTTFFTIWVSKKSRNQLRLQKLYINMFLGDY